ncbi:hypothetical protein N9Y48_03645 [Zobellia sp.]|nr:hypothetical protein [Zobellia sp.]
MAVRNTVVTTAPTAPSNPLQNDIWFDSSAEVTKIYDGTTWLTINLDALAKKEDTDNKSSDVNLSDATNTKFPTELAVKTYVDNQIDAVPDVNIYSENGILSADRTVTQNNFDLNFDANTLVVSGDDDSVGIGTDAPTATLDVNGTAKVRTLNTGAATDEVVITDTDGNLRKLPITSLETKTSISQDTSTGIITHNSEDGTSQSVNVVSANTSNSISAGTDGGAFLFNPIKAYGKYIVDNNSYLASGISSATRTAAGRFTFNMSTTRSSANYPIQLSVLETSTDNINIYVTAQTTTSFSIAIVHEGAGTFGNDIYVDRTWYFTILDYL